MSFSRLLDRVRSENVLFSALLELTYRCDLNCFLCYNDLSVRGEPVRLRAYQALFEELRSLGTMDLTFSGGEPLVHPDFFELGRYAKALGFIVRVKSNGYGIEESVARRLLEEVEPFVVELSLHGATAEVHDRQTRVEGSFERLMAHVAVMAELGLRMQFNTVLTAWNEHQIEELFALADRLGVRIQFDVRVTPRDDGSREPLRIVPSAAAVQRLFTLQRYRAEAAVLGESPTSAQSSESAAESSPGCKHCGAGSSGVAIDPWGNVYPCVQWRRKLGSLHERPIREIWEHSPVLAEIRSVTAQIRQKIQRAGAGFDRAGFCPALAEQACGEPTRFDEDTVRRRDILVELERRSA